AGHAVGAVIDVCSPSSHSKRSAHYPEYFNAGMLLIDLAQWRSRQLGDAALQILSHKGDQMQYLDQDALNHVLHDDWQSLDLQWNFQQAVYSAIDNRYPYLASRKDEMKRAIRHPGIVHYIGGTKPWHANCKHPL